MEIKKAAYQWLVAAILVTACSSIVWAGDHQHQSHDAHVHGLAELTVALEGNQLELHLASPAANIVGFEHRAVTAEQSHAVQQAEALLNSAQQLFSFSGTRCDAQEIKVDMSALEKEDAHHHNHDGHHGDKHQTRHSEVSAEYRFACAQGAELTSITVTLLELFPGIETLSTMWVIEAGQGAIVLRRGSQDIYFR